MPKVTPNRGRLLRLLHTLRLADENILAPLLVEPGFSRKALNQALWRHRKAGFLHRFPKRLPLAHSYSIVAPNVYILSAAGARDIGLAEKQVKEVEQLYDAIRYSDSHRLVERLDKSTIHAALLRGQEAGLFTLTRFKEEPWIEAVGKKARADVTYQLNGTYDVAVEIDSGEERLRSDDKSRRTIEKKVHKYGVLETNLTALRISWSSARRMDMSRTTERTSSRSVPCDISRPASKTRTTCGKPSFTALASSGPYPSRPLLLPWEWRPVRPH